MTGPKTLESHVIPSLNKAANAAGKPDGIVAAGFPVVMTDDVDGAKQYIAKTLQVYGMLPSYRAMLDREGAEGPADVAIVGDESVLREKIQQLRDIGVTDFCGSVVAPDQAAADRTVDFLASEIGR